MAVMSQADDKRRRRWFQFGLRTLLIGVAVVAGLAVAWVKTIEPYRFQRQAMAIITKLGGTYKSEDATGWVRYLDRNAQDVVVVDLADCDKPDEYLPHLVRLPKLRTLIIGGHSVGDEQLAALGKIAALRGLVLDSTKVSDQGMERLKEKVPDLFVWKSERRACVELEKVDGSVFYSEFDGFKGWATRRPDETPPDWLRQEVGDTYCEPPFRLVVLSGTWVTDTDLKWLDAFSHLQRLELTGTLVTDNGLSHLGHNDTLTSLWLGGTKISDGAVPHLAKATRLSFLDIARTAISQSGVQRLKAALPKCDIRY
jgi:hypothetical protein